MVLRIVGMGILAWNEGLDKKDRQSNLFRAFIKGLHKGGLPRIIIRWKSIRIVVGGSKGFRDNKYNYSDTPYAIMFGGQEILSSELWVGMQTAIQEARMVLASYEAGDYPFKKAVKTAIRKSSDPMKVPGFWGNLQR